MNKTAMMVTTITATQSNGPGGFHQSGYNNTSGSLTAARNVSVNNLFGPSFTSGSVRRASFSNQSGFSRGIGSGGIYNNFHNTQTRSIGGGDFIRVFP